MDLHPYGWLSILPPIVAIVLAIVTRRASVSLLVGIFCGALILTRGNPVQALFDTCEVHLWPTFIEPGKLRVFSFTILMGAMIGVVCRCGGMQGLIHVISHFAKTRRGGQLITWLLGMLIFFDDYANTILLGSTMRPLCDRLKISREKLAYLVDSTAAPVAGLSLLSTWIAVEIEYIQDGLLSLGSVADLSAIDLFLGSIPYRFYMLMSLVLIPMIALSGRDFGPMLQAERRRLKKPIADEADFDELSEDLDATVPARWYNAVLPIVATISVVVVLLYTTGVQALDLPPDAPRPLLRDILHGAQSSLALQYGALVGLALVCLMSRVQSLLSTEEIFNAAGQGARVVLPAIMILWCASTLSRMTSNQSVEGNATKVAYEYKDQRLYTGDYLAQMLVAEADDTSTGETSGSRSLMVKLLPTVVFLLAAVLSFATGSSFGTMGILLPIIITVTHALLTSGNGELMSTNPVLLGSIGGVLAGAVFGDHCSPISDTTILSSQACRCDHMAHVITQMPYALLVASVAIGLGTIPLGWGVSVWMLLPLQVIALLGLLTLFGKRVETT